MEPSIVAATVWQIAIFDAKHRQSPVAREPVATDDAVGPTRPFSPHLLTLRCT